MAHDVTSITNDACLARIHQAARLGRIILRAHANTEARNGNAQAHDMRHAIRTATRAIVQGVKVRLEGGTDIDGDGLVVVVREVHCGLVVITVF
jgi:hypothetical protein